MTGRREDAAPAHVAADEPSALPAAVLDAVPEAFLVVDAEGVVQAANAAVETFLGHKPEALFGADLAEVVLPPHARDAHRDALRDAVEAGVDGLHGPSAHRHVVCANGRERLAEVTLRPVPGASTPLFGVCLRDVPTAPTDEAALVAARDVAEARQRILRTIVDAVPDPIVAMDRTGHIILRNRASLRSLAHSGHEASRDLTVTQAGVDASLTVHQWTEADAVMRSKLPVLDHEEIDATGVPWLTTRIPVLNREGAVLGLVAISRDVTAQKAAEAKLLEDKQAAEDATRANNEFLATTSHEIRTLMNGVTGMTNLLLDTELDEDQRDFADTIRNSSNSLLTIINDILDFSKIESGMMALEDLPFSPRRTVKEAMSMVAPLAAAKGLDLAFEVDDIVPEIVVGDATRVQQVLMNLLSNALKFTETGSVNVHVGQSLPTMGAQTTLSVAVEDTGIGIAPDRLEAVFERFTQAEASTARVHGGTGLGLSICRRLVEQMGGALWAESVPDGGSVFRFTITVGVPATTGDAAAASRPLPDAWVARPLAEREGSAPAPAVDLEIVPPAPAPEAAPAPAPEPEAAPAPPPAPTPPVAEKAPAPPGRAMLLSTDAILPGARVLLAEDNPVNQKVTTLTLRRLGYRPDVVDDGAQAVAAIRGIAYDVVLMDVMMPVMDGLEATRQIRADPGQHPAPAIVALTANAMQGDRQKCLDAGCDDYLAKPVDPRLLAATIERAIRARDGQPVEA